MTLAILSGFTLAVESVVQYQHMSAVKFKSSTSTSGSFLADTNAQARASCHLIYLMIKWMQLFLSDWHPEADTDTLVTE